MLSNLNLNVFNNVFSNSLLLQTSVTVLLTNWRFLYAFVYVSLFLSLVLSIQDDNIKDEEEEIVDDEEEEEDVDNTDVEDDNLAPIPLSDEDNTYEDSTDLLCPPCDDYSDMPALISYEYIHEQNNKEE